MDLKIIHNIENDILNFRFVVFLHCYIDVVLVQNFVYYLDVQLVFSIVSNVIFIVFYDLNLNM